MCIRDSHQSEDGKYLIMGNGTDAFAIPAQQESPIKAAEMTTEQNYNICLLYTSFSPRLLQSQKACSQNRP